MTEMNKDSGLNIDQHRAWLALKKISGIGDVLYVRLIKALGSPDAVFSAEETQLLSVNGMRREVVNAIRVGIKTSAIENELQ